MLIKRTKVQAAGSRLLRSVRQGIVQQETTSEIVLKRLSQIRTGLVAALSQATREVTKLYRRNNLLEQKLDEMRAQATEHNARLRSLKQAWAEHTQLCPTASGNLETTASETSLAHEVERSNELQSIFQRADDQLCALIADNAVDSADVIARLRLMQQFSIQGLGSLIGYEFLQSLFEKPSRVVMDCEAVTLFKVITNVNFGVISVM